MPREFSRTERVSDALQRELAQLARSELRDPRVGIVNITAVDVSRDLSHAKVYANFVTEKTPEEIKIAMTVLNGAAGFLRSQLAKTVRMRSIPRLHFHYDSSGERGQQLSALIDQALSADKLKHSDQESE